MPFAVDDFYVGMIAYYSVRLLRTQGRIHSNATTLDPKPRPFICYAQEGDLCYWTAFTTTVYRYRKQISRLALRLPPGMVTEFDKSGLILYDPGEYFVGPIDAFAKASRRHDRCNGMYRPMLVVEGVERVKQIVQKRKGALPVTVMEEVDEVEEMQEERAAA